MSQKAYSHLLDNTQSKHARLHTVLKDFGPIRIVKRNKIELPTLLCRSISGQQLSVKAAATIWGRLIDKTGNKSLMTYLKNAKDEDLRTCGLSRAKTKAMFAVYESYKQKNLESTKLLQLSSLERDEVLTDIWGVGQWTADMVNIFYFGEKDIWPDKDVAVRKNFLKLIGENKNSIKESSKFGPYRTYLALMMWKVANAKPS